MSNNYKYLICTIGEVAWTIEMQLSLLRVEACQFDEVIFTR